MRRTLLMLAVSMLIGAFAFACDDDDDDGIIDGIGTEVTDFTDGDETPDAGGGEATPAGEDCPTVEPGATPDPEATVPAGCPTPSGTGGDETPSP